VETQAITVGYLLTIVDDYVSNPSDWAYDEICELVPDLGIRARLIVAARTGRRRSMVRAARAAVDLATG